MVSSPGHNHCCTLYKNYSLYHSRNDPRGGDICQTNKLQKKCTVS
uniref:Uncharacterized protein n=1 Tax=Myoviridae sp. ct5xZ3 TaxID=2827601 RepID=A0A8S5RS21_9CAUD|nr:MAG TPA: hypothetical protein [Myoviridae sp. ct5xZ3]